MPASPVPAGYLSLAEAAALIGADPAALGRWRREGIGPEATRIGGRICYHRARLMRWARPIDDSARRMVRRRAA